MDTGGEGREGLLVVVCLRSPGPVDIESLGAELGLGGSAAWRLVFGTEEEDYVGDPRPPDLDLMPVPRIRFQRPGALVLGHGPPGGSSR